MGVQIEKVSEIKTRVIISIEPEEVQAEIESAYRTMRRQAQVPGFRPGKAPMSMIKRRYKDYAEGEAKQNLVQKHLGAALEGDTIKPLGRPELEKEEFTEAGGLEIVAVMETWPDFEPTGYKGVEITQEKVNVLPAAIDVRLEGLRKRHSTLAEVTDRDVCQTGDVVRLDFIGRLDGEPIKGGSHNDYLLELGAQSFVPGFEEGVVGMKTGETKIVKVTFPETDRRDDLKGRDVDFEITLKAINSREIPALDDEFAKDTGDADTLAELRQKIHDQIKEAEEGRIKRAARGKLIDKLVDMHPIEVPQTMIDRQADYMLRSYKIDLAMAGMPIKRDDAADEEMKDKLRPAAKKEVQAFFIFAAIAKAESIEVNDDDLEKRFEEIAGLQNRPVAEVAAHYQKEKMVDSLKEELLDQKVVDFLLANAAITWEESTGDAAEQAAQE